MLVLADVVGDHIDVLPLDGVAARDHQRLRVPGDPAPHDHVRFGLGGDRPEEDRHRGDKPKPRHFESSLASAVAWSRCWAMTARTLCSSDLSSAFCAPGISFWSSASSTCWW